MGNNAPSSRRPDKAPATRHPSSKRGSAKDRPFAPSPLHAPNKGVSRQALPRNTERASAPAVPSGIGNFKPDLFFAKGMRSIPEALDRIMPLRHAHKADLPDAIRELSALLTTERHALSRSYWSSPRFVSAYLRYFLPWNMLRLHRLFTALPLPSPQEENPLVLDLGSGPLSVPLALWLSRPAWRKAAVRLHCSDTAPRPMHIGLALLEQLAAMLDEPLRWSVHLDRAPLAKVLNKPDGKPYLITAGNVLNEWEGQELEDAPVAERLGEIAYAVSRRLAPSGHALFIEPGTRLGGTLTATLRTQALEEGLFPLAPCTHQEACPLLGNRARGWCHVHDELTPGSVPFWLKDLSQKARLPKQSISFSYVLLHASDGEATPEKETAKPEQLVNARLLSDAFQVPTLGFARYACSKHGLLLIPHAGELGAGQTVRCLLPETPRRDAKSGAIIAQQVEI